MSEEAAARDRSVAPAHGSPQAPAPAAPAHTSPGFLSTYGQRPHQPPLPGEPPTAVARLRSLGWFFIAAFYTLFAREIGARLALLLPPTLPPPALDLFRLLFTLLLLCVGYAGMSLIGQNQRSPLRAMGLAVRPGALREWALGAALGWAGILACVLPIALFGGLILRVTSTPAAWLALLGTTLFLALASLAEEVAFRGYPFQCLVDATGPTTATLLLSALFASAHLGNPDASLATWCSTFLAGALFSLAYLRTRALWLGWGMHFAWNAATALLFGLPLSGLTDYSPVLSSYTRGPVWLTGGGYGPEGSATVLPVLLLLLLALTRVTVDLKDRWATPAIVPGGYPVDIDALSRAQHAHGMGQAPATQAPLVQIASTPRAPSDPNDPSS